MNLADDYSKWVIYQILTDRFHDGKSGDKLACGHLRDPSGEDLTKYLGGDWQGITDKINDGYFTDMGVNALWISQPVENVMALHNGLSSYHGYWARDFKRHNPLFGSLQDFRNLIETAHAHGMKVVIDFAPHQTSPVSDEDPSFMEDGVLLNNGQFIASYSNDPHHYFHHVGDIDEIYETYEDGLYKKIYGLAGLNVHHPFIDQYLKEAVYFWMELGIDGFRIDSVRHLPIGWLKSFTQTIHDKKPIFVFGEWFLGKHSRNPRKSKLANESGMGMLDFAFANKLTQIIHEKEEDWSGLSDILQTTEQEYDRPHELVTFIDNHDLPRFTRQRTELTDIALVILLTSRGIPSIYYGTEQYMTGDSEPSNRKMMTAFNRDTPAYQIIKKLAKMRNDNLALVHGDTEVIYKSADVIVYERSFNDSVVLVAVNLSNESTRLNKLHTRLKSGMYENTLYQFFGKQMVVVNVGLIEELILNPYQSVVIESVDCHCKSPVVTHLYPSVCKKGDRICLYGTCFSEGQGTVWIGSSSAKIINWSTDQIMIEIPDLIPGDYNIKIILEDGTETALFEYVRIITDRQVSVQFIVNHAYTEDDEQIYLMGNVVELGNWDPQKAIGPFFRKVLYQYPSWYCDASIPAGKHLEFKLFKRKFTGEIQMEEGENHKFISPEFMTLDRNNGKIMVDWGR
ncbi:alpha-amylase family glycosyl hydrolase [Paenibacillus xylaniclasticus]|uniref:alpha-amylase family glycosyl hydrolase n=1 Tax=Paenibacillus xylaniclasticus TaxID=588083 RepID=UPI000FDC71A6|nr:MULTISPECIES: alpha-amylase family glycosyl hydrolase [Paenibacillus]GFN33045.1 putative cyclomaltodextrin glucanotransferase [Paenibacillus curdlanolyticus]